MVGGMGWGRDGTLFDCDFNQQLALPLPGVTPKNVWDLKSLEELVGKGISVDSHCFGYKLNPTLYTRLPAPSLPPFRSLCLHLLICNACEWHFVSFAYLPCVASCRCTAGQGSSCTGAVVWESWGENEGKGWFWSNSMWDKKELPLGMLTFLEKKRVFVQKLCEERTCGRV